MIKQADILNNLITSFSSLAKDLGFQKPIVINDRFISEIYSFDSVLKNYALELEIDWHEFNLCMFIVNIIDGKIPRDVIYTYDSGQWCRKYIDEIYHIKDPRFNSKKHTEDFLYCKLDFYKNIIRSNPEIIYNYFR